VSAVVLTLLSPGVWSRERSGSTRSSASRHPSPYATPALFSTVLAFAATCSFSAHRRQRDGAPRGVRRSRPSSCALRPAIGAAGAAGLYYARQAGRNGGEVDAEGVRLRQHRPSNRSERAAIWVEVRGTASTSVLYRAGTTMLRAGDEPGATLRRDQGRGRGARRRRDRRDPRPQGQLRTARR
jgi:hypothetical protein